MLNLASRIPHFSEKHHGEVETRLANQFLNGFQGGFLGGYQGKTAVNILKTLPDWMLVRLHA